MTNHFTVVLMQKTVKFSYQRNYARDELYGARQTSNLDKNNMFISEFISEKMCNKPALAAVSRQVHMWVPISKLVHASVVVVLQLLGQVGPSP
jgi:hypothetical protein